MNKKILFFIFCGLLIFFPMARVSATASVYVGVQVSGATAPGCVSSTGQCGSSYSSTPGYMTDNNWCLPSGVPDYYGNPTGTQMAVTTTGTCPYFDGTYGYYDPNTVCSNSNYCGTGYCLQPVSSTNPVYATYPLCPEKNTIWSGPFNLTSGNSYQVYLYTPNFCPGYLNGYCWVSAPSLPSSQQDCCDICAYYGLATTGGEGDCSTSTGCPSPYYTNYDDSNCTTEAQLMGSSCSGGCTTGDSTYGYYNSTTKKCFTSYDPTYSTYPSSSCAAPLAGGYDRVCACDSPNTATGFYFPFTASF